jgi:hypothetical protein
METSGLRTRQRQIDGPPRRFCFTPGPNHQHDHAWQEFELVETNWPNELGSGANRPLAGAESSVVLPDWTSYVERQNGSLRQWCKQHIGFKQTLERCALGQGITVANRFRMLQ